MRITVGTQIIWFLLTCLLRGMTFEVLVILIGYVAFLLTCLLRGMTDFVNSENALVKVSTHMPLARHDLVHWNKSVSKTVSTHMPLARHDHSPSWFSSLSASVSTHMPLARHDIHVTVYCTNTSVSTHMPLARHDSCMRL